MELPPTKEGGEEKRGEKERKKGEAKHGFYITKVCALRAQRIIDESSYPKNTAIFLVKSGVLIMYMREILFFFC